LIVCNRTGAEKTLDFWNAPSLVVQNGTRLLAHTSKKSAVLTFKWDFEGMVLRSPRYSIDYIRH
jgi:N-carbamoylputrescine amidase